MPVVEVSRDYGGRLLTLQTGKLAKQANAAVVCKYGDTTVLVTVVSATELGKSQGFFPLTVDFQEKYYSAGRIPGGFFKREARPSDRATLSARLIDRPIRPLFPEDYMFETHVVATVLSNDGVNEPEIVASIAASAALQISDIPWTGPIASCRVGLLNGEFVVNILPANQEESLVNLLVSGGRDGVVMVEGSAKEVSERQMVDAIDFAHQSMQAILDLQDEFRTQAGKAKREYQKPVRDEALKQKMKVFLNPLFREAFAVREKLARYEALGKLTSKVTEKFGTNEPKTKEEETLNQRIDLYYEELKAEYARETTLNSQARIDGRAYNAIRPIACEVGILPRAHGSGLFTRGETQVLSVATLGTSDDEQKIDAITGVYQKTFMLHYNFPPFSVGEARPLRGPGRREIGHGFLAERALSYVIPPKEKFPYTVRLVSEVLESNGSSSMATVCSGSLALMDAGIPVTKAVAGVAMGLIKEGEKVAVLSDILGDEDHLGDMDFKVCGTQDGITAFQMDLKIGGVSRAIMEKALDQAREGRLHILGEMRLTLEAPRSNFSPYAPRIYTIKVKPDKVREVIGSGGKVIRGIIEQTGVKIDIEDDGSIHIASADEASAQKAIDIINRIVEEPEIGRIYEGKVMRVVEFGAFVEIIPGTEGLVHISELDHYRVRRVEDVLHEGDTVKVKCLDVDPQGKIRLSRKALLERNPDAKPPQGASEIRENRGGGNRDFDDRKPRPGYDNPRRDRGGNPPDDRGARDDRGPRPDRDRGGNPPDDRGARDDRGAKPDRDRGGDRDRFPRFGRRDEED